MPIYTSNSPQPIAAEHGICVTNTVLGNTVGRRLLFQSHSHWVLIPSAGQMGHATGNDAGIYTKGQMQCIAIIVARFNQGVWTDAHLAHVSHPNHSLIQNLLANHTHPNSFVAIGAKPASLNWMNQIAQTFAPHVSGVWIYVGGNNSPDFGMNNRGYFGETVSWVRAR